jgi:hypothetical protein
LSLLISFIIGSTSSVLVLLGTFRSYKQFVEKQVANRKDSENQNLDRDYIDKLEDPFDLYDDEQQNQTDKNHKEIIQEEKKRFSPLKNKKEIAKTLPVQFGFSRIIGYVFLIGGFIFLKESNLLNIASYLIGITFGIIAISLFKHFFAKMR